MSYGDMYVPNDKQVALTKVLGKICWDKTMDLSTKERIIKNTLNHYCDELNIPHVFFSINNINVNSYLISNLIEMYFIIVNKPSVVSILHEFRHHMQYKKKTLEHFQLAVIKKLFQKCMIKQ